MELQALKIWKGSYEGLLPTNTAKLHEEEPHMVGAVQLPPQLCVW